VQCHSVCTRSQFENELFPTHCQRKRIMEKLKSGRGGNTILEFLTAVGTLTSAQVTSQEP